MIAVKTIYELYNDRPIKLYFLIIRFPHGNVVPQEQPPFGLPDWSTVEMQRTNHREEFEDELKRLYRENPARTDVIGLAVSQSATISIEPVVSLRE